MQHKLDTVLRAAWNRPFYRQHWRQHGLVQTIDDVLDLARSGRFHQLPCVRKSDLRRHLDNVVVFDGAVDVFSSSGTTGRPVDIPIHHREEPGRVGGLQRVLRELGVGRGSRILQLLSLNDLFALGPLAWQAAKAEGACVFRCTPQRAGRMRQVLEYHRPQFVMGNPFALVRIAEQEADWWPDRHVLPDHAFLAVAATFDRDLEPTPVVKKAAELWGFTTWLNHYGSSELGPVACECREHRGLHVHSDVQFAELVDPRSNQPITAPDQPGELVVTGLSLPRGFLPIRYATGDMAAWLRMDPCPCGRTSPRLGPIIGRINRQLKVCGQTVFPEFLVDLADHCPGVRRSAVRVRTGPLGDDEVTVLVLPSRQGEAEQTRRLVHEELSRNLAVAPAVHLTSTDQLAALEADASRHSNLVKIPRFFDFREDPP
ncbi:MAG: AMP-binding protein [Proteobacteria bacterium]|nr:AMP-binding protein [Pseudomonadota bacterium]